MAQLRDRDWPPAFRRAYEERAPKKQTVHQVLAKFVAFADIAGASESLARTPDRQLAARFVAHLTATMTPGSATTYRLALREALAAIYPATDWEWLRHKKQWGIPLERWPAALRERYLASDIKSKSPASVFGRLLAHAAELGTPLDEAPTKALIDTFVERLKTITPEGDISHSVSDLFYALAAVHPPRQHWRWLRRRYRDKDAAPPPRPKRAAPYALPEKDWPAGHREGLMATAGPRTAESLIARLLSPMRRREVPGTDIAEPASIAPSSRQWRPETRDSVLAAYGLYLGAIHRGGLPLRITPDGLRAFVAEMEARGCLIGTILLRCSCVYRAAQVLEPGVDWRWLRELCRQYADLLQAWSVDPELVERTPARKYGMVVNAAEVWLLGQSLIDHARRTENDLEAALCFRDGAILCLLASAPMRVGTLAKIDIGGHLRIEEDDAVAVFSWEETKEQRDETWPLPPEAAVLLREWTDEYRTRIAAPGEKALWVGLAGARLTAPAISRSIAALTQQRLQRRIPAHRIRDCVVSTIAEQAPDKTKISRYLLKHGSDGVTRIYDAHAPQTAAVCEYRATSKTLVETIERDLRAIDPHQPKRRTITELREAPRRRRRRRHEMPRGMPGPSGVDDARY